MNKKRGGGYIIAGIMMLLLGACDPDTGPDLTGEIVLSSQRFLSETYYLNGYSFQDGKMYKFPWAEEPYPDIINEDFRIIDDGKVVASMPGFNTPGRVNGFALVGEFGSQAEAKVYYDGYKEVEGGLLFETTSDTVKLHQVWIQKTATSNFVKLLVKEIREFESEGEIINNEVTLEFFFQPDGSTTFG